MRSGSAPGSVRQFAKDMRANPTDAERKLWRLLRDRRLGGVKFRRQTPLGRYIVDFVSFEHRLVVEADGGQHHGAVGDAVRDAWLDAAGYRILRFWNHEILREPQVVLDTILRELANGDPSPLPSPARGEGGFDSVPGSATAVPGGENPELASSDASPSGMQGVKREETAPMPKPPSPLAGESLPSGLTRRGKGEGSRRNGAAP